jgi:hypothetical protein
MPPCFNAAKTQWHKVMPPKNVLGNIAEMPPMFQIKQLAAKHTRLHFAPLGFPLTTHKIFAADIQSDTRQLSTHHQFEQPQLFDRARMTWNI